ncbi:hypothetical protein Bca4012_009231 [Brassica carinata]
MYKTTSSSIFRAASSRSPLFSSRSSLTQSSSSSAAASPSPSQSLLGRRSFATSSPAFRSLPRWSHCLHSRPSLFRLSSQIRTVSPGLDRLQKNFSSMASEHPFKGIFTTLPKPGGGEFGKFYSLPALNDPRIDKLPYSIRILLESAIRNCDNFQVTKEDVEKIIDWEKTAPKQVEIPFKPARLRVESLGYLASHAGPRGGLWCSGCLMPDRVVVSGAVVLQDDSGVLVICQLPTDADV